MNKIHNLPSYAPGCEAYVKNFLKRLSTYEHSPTRYYHDHSCSITETAGICTCGLTEILKNLSIHESVYINERVKHEVNCKRPGEHIDYVDEIKMPICKVKI